MLERNNSDNLPTQYSNPIKFQDVSLSIGNEELIHNITCSLDTISKTVVMGPNGAGKSLFLRLIARLLEPTSGIISGGIPAEKSIDPGCLSMVFQSPVLLRRSVFANVSYVLQRQNLTKKTLADKVESALSSARLDSKMQTPARRLSGGEKQRLALARALVVKPGTLLLDEATASLDPVSTHIVEGMVNTAASNGTKIVFVTHDVRQAKRIGDDILFIHLGRSMVHKSARDFFKDPESEEAQAYLDGRVPNQDR